MIVTIDGPAGAGKSRAARGLAKKMGFRFLDTGAMYRAITLKAARQAIDWKDSEAMAQIALEIRLKITEDRVFVDGEDVTDAIRSFEITSHTHHAADNPTVRKRLVELQRQIGDRTDLVTEGRDQATVVFPDAECKIYLTASAEVRAQRRYDELRSRGEQISFDEVLKKQHERDNRDLKREHGGLRKADDSIEICTDGQLPEEVICTLEKLVHSRKSR